MTLPTSMSNPDTEPGWFGAGSAHAKAILLGEHAVLYGSPALAVPAPQLAVKARARQFGETGDVSFLMLGPEPGRSRPCTFEGLRLMAAALVEMAGTAASGRVEVLLDCAIPPRRGLGSSAACARAGVLALADLLGLELDSHSVFELVQTAENVAHGRASGIDALATGSSFPILFHDGVAEQVRIGFDGLFVIADSGTDGNTKDAVELVRRGFERRPGARAAFVGAVSELTRAAARDLVDGDATRFGRRLTECHGLLGELALSTELIDAMVDAALAAGGLGAKISGGGLGGCVIALADRPDRAEKVVDALHSAGAAQTWVVPVGRFAGDAN